MSKFIRVTSVYDDSKILIPVSSITHISEMCTKGSWIEYYDQSFNAKESLEQIETQILRDEFAMTTLSGAMDGVMFRNLVVEDAVEAAYEIADAMLKERSK